MSSLHTFIYPEGPSAVRILIKLPQKFCSFLICLNLLHQGWKTVSSLNCRDLNLGDFETVSVSVYEIIVFVCLVENVIFFFHAADIVENTQRLYEVYSELASVCI
jgi:hypothetical protein